MAFYCMDCMNEHYTHHKLRKRDVLTALDFCDHCQKFKLCVMVVKPRAQYKLGTKKISRYRALWS